MKRGPLSNSDKTFIEENRNQSIDDLSLQLDRPINQIQRYLEELPVVESKTEMSNTTRQLLHPRKGVTVMHGDLLPEGALPKNERKLKEKLNRCIHKIR